MQVILFSIIVQVLPKQYLDHALVKKPFVSYVIIFVGVSPFMSIPCCLLSYLLAKSAQDEDTFDHH